MTDVFRQVRQRVTAQEAARRYGLAFDRRGRARCPFHDDRHPSMSFKDTCYWENLGSADCVAEQQARWDYQGSPIVKTIKKLLEQSPEGWSGTAQQLLDAGRYIARTSLAVNARDLSSKLKGLGKPLFDYDGIVYERKSNGSGGGKHTFSYMGTQFEEPGQIEIGPFSEG